MSDLIRDLRFALRGLLRTPGFTAAAVLALSLGIGATTAIFSVVHAVLLRSLGWGEESRLVAIRGNFPGQQLLEIPVSAAEYLDLRRAPFLESVGLYRDTTAALQGERAERVKAGFATGSFFTAIGVQPVLGRAFEPDADRQGNEGSVMLSYAAWRKRFGGDPEVLGRSLTVDGKPRAVVGVLPAGFRWDVENEIWLPFGWSADEIANQRGNRGYSPIARLRPGITLAAASHALDQLSAEVRAAYPKWYGMGEHATWRWTLTPLRDRFVGTARQPLLVLLGAVLFVLLIACANVANLLLARGAARAREIAVRSALGAARGRLVRQLLTESGLLAAMGAAGGVLLAVWSLDLLLAAAPPAIRQLADVRVSWALLAFASALTILTTLACGLAPALQVTRGDASEALKDGGRAGSSRGGRLRSGLIIGQVALSLVLLAGAGLLLRSFAEVLRVDAGFTPEGVLAAEVSLSGDAYREDAAMVRFWDEALRRVAALPGAQAAGGVNIPPLHDRSDWSYELEGYAPPTPDAAPDDEMRRTLPGYFETLRIALRQGRTFTAADDARAPYAAMVNEAWVRKYLPGQDPVGKRLRFGYGEGDFGKWRTIVGVVADTHDFGIDARSPPVYYLPQAQLAPTHMVLMVRSSNPAALMHEMRAALATIDPAQPVDWVQPWEERVESALAPRRFPLQLLGAFAALALALSALGIYGVTSYAVTQRTREIGVRLAIGAQPRDVLAMVMGGALRLAAMGVGIGLFVSLLGARVLAAQLYGVGARDPLTYSGIAALLGAVAVFASWLPARRATRVDPAVALRAE
ncbi:MAG TPA: ABC transporter permease [Myxococcales bacterium]